MTPYCPPLERASWRRLQQLASQPQPHLRDLLASAPDAPNGPDTRHARLQFDAAGLRLDASRQAVTPAVMDALLALAEETDLLGQAAAQRRGEAINTTEGRAALHVALRGGQMQPAPWGEAIAASVAHELDRFLQAAERLRQGQWRGASGQRITDVVNLGIGGSDLGPRMACQALAARATSEVKVHFVSNPDAWSLHQVLRGLNAGRTVFIVQSKSFTTRETLVLAASARRWLADHGIDAAAQSAHLVAVTASPQASARQGYDPAHTFGFWDWVGGRYSVWSAIGLPLAIALGADGFRAFLAGGHAMDRHFWEAPLARNLPVWLALLGVWNRNFLGCPSQLIAPYASRLVHLVPFLQQLEMESNGKGVHVDGQAATVATAPVLWGGLGIDGQHAYFQLLHQGMHRVPVDFIGVEQEDTPLPLAAEHHRLVNVSLQAQARALAEGRDEAQTLALLQASGLGPAEAAALAPHRSFRGNVPSNLLWLPELSPTTLGALVAAYEHKVFCQAALWGIHAYDQWGVELGKTLAQSMEQSAPG